MYKTNGALEGNGGEGQTTNVQKIQRINKITHQANNWSLRGINTV